MKAPEVPPLTVRASDQSPDKIAGRLSKFSGAWSEIGADPWVMRIVQWGYKISFVTLPPLRLQGQETTYPKGSLKWSSLNQSVQELRNKGAIEPAPLTPGFYSRLFLVRKATGEWRPIIDLSSLNVFVHCPSFTMETPRSILRALQQGQWLTSLDLKDGWGAHLQELTASGIWSQDQSQLHINVLELQAIWLGLRAFSQSLENARVALMSDNMSAVAYLRNQGGTNSLAMSDLATDICLWSEKRVMTLVPRYLPGHLNVLADHLSRRGQILKTEWSLNQTVADRIFRAWGRPFVDLFALGKNTKLAIYVSPIREETSWKVDSLVQNWNGLYAYAYPPTSLIRACLNKVRTENVEIVLIAPGWPNQEWFPDLLDLAIDFPITLPPVQKLLKQTFSHHFHPHPSNLNLHAWRLSRDSTRREDFLKRLPKGSLYLRDNPQQGFTNLNGKCSESGAMLSKLILSRQLSNSYRNSSINPNS